MLAASSGTDLTPEVLDELERLEKAATPSPWFTESSCRAYYRVTRMAESNELIADVSPMAGPGEARAAEVVWTLALIAEARNALPALIAAARDQIELRGLFDELCESLDVELHDGDFLTVGDIRTLASEDAEADNKRLRERVAELEGIATMLNKVATDAARQCNISKIEETTDGGA